MKLSKTLAVSFVTFALLLTRASFIHAQDQAPEQTQVQEKAPYGEPALLQDGGWTMVIVPDPQAYTRYGRNQGIYDLMTAWIAESKEKLNILQVVCVGDLVESNNLQKPDGKFANQTSKQMWECTSRAFSRLDGIYPYVLVTGNHDYGPYIYPDGKHYGTRSSLNRETQFNAYFPSDRNPAWKGVLKEMFENAYGAQTLENAAYEITAPNGTRVLIVALEFAPRPEAVAWAKELFARPENADVFGVLVTHSYLLPFTRECKRDLKENYGLNKDGGLAGEAIWEQLVQPSSNIRMVISGHHSTADDMDGCSGFRVDTNAAGKTVSQIIFDVQAMGGGWEGNGGDGWLQLLEFSHDMKNVRVRTFSPLFNISPVTREHAWYLDDKQDFEFSIE